ncbi:hypothetical protein BpHYR1_016779 [Brachionus plicatilis]|uniref:Uncharacterized protein n=1 Tax=Brachionus plicatilis TaxID=10195 RepID=A0A3M7PPR1_BRAPC|nr:hypothetical protein BpHYR1_016779 [Brachionus plicatilis]
MSITSCTKYLIEFLLISAKFFNACFNQLIYILSDQIHINFATLISAKAQQRNISLRRLFDRDVINSINVESSWFHQPPTLNENKFVIIN